MNVVHALKTVKYSSNVVVIDDELLHKIQNRLVCMMKDIVDVFEKYNIKWSLSGGSIIGAVRHQGFIPWDDDIDIFMERKEFERFKNIFDDSLSQNYELKIPGDDGYLFHFPQIHDKKSRIKDIQSVGDSTEGLFIDIFILENTYENIFFRLIHGIESTLLLFIDSSVRMRLCRDNILKYSVNNKDVRKTVDKRARWAFLFRFKRLEEWLLISEKCFSKVTKESKYVVCPSGGHHFFGEIFLREEMCNLIKVNFGEERWYIPQGYDYYLTARYGSDYMTIPKEEDRESHVYIEINLDVSNSD